MMGGTTVSLASPKKTSQLPPNAAKAFSEVAKLMEAWKSTQKKVQVRLDNSEYFYISIDIRHLV